MSGADAGGARGFFIVIEGIDGTGKSTLAAALAVALRERGREVVTSFEPTDRSEEGRRIRALAKAGQINTITLEEEQALFMEDRRRHLESLILPALAAGKVVVLDRYYYSTMAYQGAKGADPAAVEAAHKGFAPAPDLLIILELPVAEALRRIQQKRGDTPDDFEGAAFLERVAEIFAGVKHPHCLRLDATLPTGAMVAAAMKTMAASS